MMTLTVTLIFTLSQLVVNLEAVPGADEVVRSAAGDVMALSNSTNPASGDRLVVSNIERDRLFTWWDAAEATGPRDGRVRYGIDWSRVGGSQMWGVAEGAAYYMAVYGVGPHESINFDSSMYIHGGAELIEDRIAFEEFEAVDDWESISLIIPRMHAFQNDHGFVVSPLKDYLKDHSEHLAENWNLWYDILPTSLHDVVAIAVRDGSMLVWDLDDTGAPLGEWTAREPFATQIDGPFRALRAGDDLATTYFIDETGAIYTGFGAEHAEIGTVQNFASPDPDTLTLVFEDQMTEKIGIMHAPPGEPIVVLPIDWINPDHAENFITSIEDANLRTDLDRVADFLREDRPPE